MPVRENTYLGPSAFGVNRDRAFTQGKSGPRAVELALSKQVL